MFGATSSTGYAVLDVGTVLAAAARALSRARNHDYKVVDGVPLGAPNRRHLIASARAVDASGASVPVIVKASCEPTYDIGAPTAFEDQGLVRECVAAAYLKQHHPHGRHGATLLAFETASGTLVYEDLASTGDRRTLDTELLNGTAIDAETALTRQARAIGRLHAATVGCRDAHHATYEKIVGAARPVPEMGWPTVSHALEVASLLDVAENPLHEWQDVEARLARPGPWLVLRHGDACPDNVLLCDDEARLLDYEFSRPGHAMLDMLYWRLGFPNCWCAGRVPARAADRIEATYRAEISAVMPMARDEAAFATERAHVAVAWLVNRLHLRLARSLEVDVPFRVGTLRGRVLYHLSAVIELTDAAAVLPGINAAARRWRAELGRRWPETRELDFYPAFAALI